MDSQYFNKFQSPTKLQNFGLTDNLMSDSPNKSPQKNLSFINQDKLNLIPDKWIDKSMSQEVLKNLDKAIFDIKKKIVEDNDRKIIENKRFIIPNLNMNQKRSQVLPDFIKELGNPEIFQDNGIFPEIERSWKTFDNRLFIWNHSDLNDITIWEASQTIIAIALVVPRKDLFIAEIKYLLFIATPLEVIVLAVLFQGNTIHGEMKLQTTNISITSDDINFSCIVGTQNGRVFMGGGDGNLYEFEYEEKSGWLFNKKSRKRNHTQTTIDYLIPSFLSWGGVDPIVRICVDESRNLLYTLSEKSTITLYSLGYGKSLTKMATLSNIANNPIVRQIGVTSETFKIIYIAPITSSEATNVNLVAVTRLGRRIYFNTNRNALTHTSIEVYDAKDLVDNIPRNVHKAFYKDGTLIISSRLSEHEDDLIYIRVEASQIGKDTEEMNQLKINCRVLSITEQPQKSVLNQLVDNFVINHSDQKSKELISQYYSPKRIFVCLTNEGTIFIEKLRPRDQLEYLLLRTSGRIDSKEINNFFKYYGYEESCLMCLLLCCSSSTSQTVSEWAARVFQQKGSEVMMMGQEKSFKYTSICLYVSRLLRNVWELNLFTLDKNLMGDLKEIYNQLLSLSNFMKSNNLLPQNPQIYMSNMVYSNEDILLSRIHLLLVRCAEALQLLIILINDPQLCKLIPEIDKFSETAPTNFFVLATQPAGSKLVLKLIPEMLGLLPSLQEKKMLNEKLENSCPTLYNKILKEKYCANQIIDSATELRGTEFLHSNLMTSLEIYMRLAPHLSLSECEYILNKYESLKFYNGYVKLALNISKYKSNEEVFEIYKHIYDLLENLRKSVNSQDYNIVKQIAIDGGNEHFFAFLFQQYESSNNVAELLPETSSPPLEKFLKTQSEMFPQYRDTLANYYKKFERYDEATRLFIDLATTPNLSLENRFFYLRKASSIVGDNNCQRVSPTTRNLVNVTFQNAEIQSSMLEAALDINENLSENEQNENVEKLKNLIAALSIRLLPLNELLQISYMFSFHEITLRILSSVGSYQEPVVYKCWKKILKREASNTRDITIYISSVSEKIRAVSNNLNKSTTYNFFPVEMICYFLEKASLSKRVPEKLYSWVYRFLLELGISYETLYNTYAQILTKEDYPYDKSTISKKKSSPLKVEIKFHIAHVFCEFIHSWRAINENRQKRFFQKMVNRTKIKQFKEVIAQFSKNNTQLMNKWSELEHLVEN